MNQSDLNRSCADDTAFARSEFERAFIRDESIDVLAVQGCQQLLSRQYEAAPVLTRAIIEQLKRAQPYSLIRVGDSEGTCFGLTRDFNRAERLQAFNRAFAAQEGSELSVEEAVSFSRLVYESIVSANTIGFRAIERSRDRPELDILTKAIELRLHVAALGGIYEREFLHECLKKGLFIHKTLTSAWVNLTLIPYLGDIMNSANAVIVISGRSQLKEAFKTRLGERLQMFLDVPVEKRRAKIDQESHFRSAFPRTLDCLQSDLRGVLVLVGAGLFGKVYCQTAKTNGAVAIDLGSAFDILAGLTTRLEHPQYGVKALSWI